MSTRPRQLAPAAPSRDANARLQRLLDTPHLARVVPHLRPEVLHALVRDHGLDACSALIAASTPRQLTAVLDLDLWRTTPGGEDRFDERRFGSWLDMLMDADERLAARVIAAVDQRLVIAGLSRHVRVFDPGVHPQAATSDDDRPDLDASSSNSQESEIGGYLVRARTAHAWDAIVRLLVVLADDRADLFHALMQGCRRLSNSTPEADGLDDLLLDPDQVRHDVSIAREHRRSRQGYLAAGDARAFLQMARTSPSLPPGGSIPVNPIAAAYFRALDEGADPPDAGWRSDKDSARRADDVTTSEPIETAVDLLEEPRTASARRALPGRASVDDARVTPLEPLLEHVRDRDPAAHVARSRELAFLANALLAGCSVDARAFTAQEAWSAAAGVCNVGLGTSSLPDAFLADHDLITTFEAGWRLLHEEVTLFVADRVIAALAHLRSADPSIDRDLHRLRRELARRHRDAGTPWHAREALDVIAMLDTPTWAALRGLLGECPVLPAVVTAVIDRHAGPVSATAFTCFATRAHVHRAQTFASSLRRFLLS